MKLGISKMIDFDSINPTSSFLARRWIEKFSIVRLPFSIGRTIRGVSYDNIDDDILGSAVVNMARDNININDFSEKLAERYKIEEKMKISDILPFKHKNQSYYERELFSMVYPWENVDSEQYHDNYKDIFIKNRIKDGMLKDGCSFYSKENAVSQALQTNKLVQSVNSNGWIDDDYTRLPKVVILSDGKKMVWHMSRSGNHRGYVRYALGYDYLLARIQVFTSLNEAHAWKNVRNGAWALDDAVCIFNKIFEGKAINRGTV